MIVNLICYSCKIFFKKILIFYYENINSLNNNNNNKKEKEKNKPFHINNQTINPGIFQNYHLALHIWTSNRSSFVSDSHLRFIFHPFNGVHNNSSCAVPNLSPIFPETNQIPCLPIISISHRTQEARMGSPSKIGRD